MTSIIKWSAAKYQNFYGSTVSKFVTRKSNEVNDLSGSRYSINKNL